MVNLASPTGEERPLAAHISDKLNVYGIDASVQTISETQANAFGARKVEGAEKTLMLYAPIDTVTSNSEAEDSLGLALIYEMIFAQKPLLKTIIFLGSAHIIQKATGLAF